MQGIEKSDFARGLFRIGAKHSVCKSEFRLGARRRAQMVALMDTTTSARVPRRELFTKVGDGVNR